MGLMRPGTRIRFWSPNFSNKPSPEPPALLRAVAVLSYFSVVGVMSYIGLAIVAWVTMG